MQPLQKRLICREGSKLASVVSRFSSSHTPLLVLGKSDEFLGLLTVERVLLKRRYNPTTLVESGVIGSPYLTESSDRREVIKSMLELRLYTLPVFDKKKKVVGVISAKKILREMVANKQLLAELGEKEIRKPVITIAKNALVRDAFKLFLTKSVSRLVVVDEKGKMVGVVTKRDILSEYLSKTKRQRFSTRAVPKNYSFDKEQIRRGDDPISLFYSPGKNVHPEKITNQQAIEALIKARFNTIILVDDEQKPQALVSMRNVLKVIMKLLSKQDELTTVITDLPEDLSEKEKEEVGRELKKLAGWINRKEKVQWMKFITRPIFSIKKKMNNFETRLNVFTDIKTYNANPESDSFWKAFKEAVRRIKKQVTREES